MVPPTPTRTPLPDEEPFHPTHRMRQALVRAAGRFIDKVLGGRAPLGRPMSDETGELSRIRRVLPGV
ncbi:MAG: hypothetical protein ACXWZL_04225 [Mycobacterium sp.]